MSVVSDDSKICVLAWNHLATNPGGQLRLCCTSTSGLNLIKTPEGKPIRLKDITDLETVRNNAHYLSLRQQMLKGELPQACIRCAKEEGLGIASARVNWNAAFAHDFQTIINQKNSTASLPIKSIDLRLGNLCNLKCRMCNPYSSRKWLEDWQEVVEKLSVQEADYLANNNWFESENVWSVLPQVLEKCEKIYLTGGEPLLINKQIILLKYCIDHGFAANIELRYNSNLTVLPQAIMSLWPAFKAVQLNCSVDAVSSLNEYIRFPSQWKVVDQNLQQLNELKKTLPQLELTVHTTLQNYNFLYLDELLDYVINFENLGKIPYINILDNPSHLNIQCLPSELKKIGQQKLQKWLGKNQKILQELSKDKSISDRIEKLQQINSYVAISLEQSRQETEFLQFQKFTKQLDQIREQSFLKTCPDFSEHFV